MWRFLSRGVSILREISERQFAERRVERRFAIIGVITAIIAAVAAAISGGVGIAQWFVFDRTLNEMQVEHRAWAYATPDFSGAISDDGKFLSVPVNYTLENTGGSPAMQAWVIGMLLPVRQGEILRFQSNVCTKIRTSIGTQPAQPHTIFPGQKLIISRIEGIDKALALRMIQKRAPVGDLDFWLIGCTDYKIIGDEAHHQSGFIYGLARALGNTPSIKIEMFRGDDPNKITPVPFLLGGFEAD